MAINERVGILTIIPGESLPQPGLVDGIYAVNLTKDFDFLDDATMRPLATDFRSNPMDAFGGGDWEDLATTYRQWRDEFSKQEREYWLSRVWKDTLTFRNADIDPHPLGSNTYEHIRLVYPSREGVFNFPYPDPVGSDKYSFFNRRRNLYKDYTLFRMPDVKSMFEQFAISEMPVAAGYIWDPVNQVQVPANRFDYVDPMGEEVRDADGNLTGYVPVTYPDSNVEDIYWSTFRARKDQMNWLITTNFHRDLTPDEEVQLTHLKDFFINFDKDYFYDLTSPYGKSDEVLESGLYWPPYLALFRVLSGAESLNILPPFKTLEEARLVTGNRGDIARILNDGGNGWDFLIWDEEGSTWENNAANISMSDIDTMFRARRDARLKAKNELALSMRPFIFAALDIPSFQVTTDGTLEGQIRNF